MSTPLSRRTFWKVCGSLVAIGAATVISFARLHAQNITPVNTPEQVTREFLAQLKPAPHREISRMFGPVANTLADDDSDEPNASLANSFESALKSILAQKSLNQLGEDGAEKLFREIADTPPPLRWRVLGGQNATDPAATGATVQVAPESDSAFPVVCVRENNAWRVDLVETFGKWFGLNRSQKEARVFALTGIPASDLSSGNDDGRGLCQRNLKQIALGMRQYTEDYDEMYPPAKHWCDVLQPYLKSENILHCPATNGNYGYAMNWKMSRKNESAINESALDVLLYESLTQRRNHAGEGKGIAFRHGNGTNIAFADCHVKWFEKNSAERWPNVLFNVR